MAKLVISGFQPIKGYYSQDIAQYPITTADQIWVLDDKEEKGYKPLDQVISTLTGGIDTAKLGVFTSAAPDESGNVAAISGAKVGDLVIAANGGIYKVKAIAEDSITLALPPLAQYDLAGSADAVKKIADTNTANITKLTGYFDADGNANNALKLNNHPDTYFATAEALQGVADKAAGIKTSYVYENVDAMKAALTGDDKAQFSIGDTIYLTDAGVPDYWISGGNATDGWQTSELESKTQINLDDVTADINQAKTDAIAAAKTETTNQITALTNGQVTTNKNDIALLKDPKATAQTGTVGVTVAPIAEGEDAGKLQFNFSIPAGEKGEKGDKGDTGETGKSQRIATINILSNTDVEKTYIKNSDGIQVGDYVVDANGEVYTVTAVAKDTIHVSNAIDGISFKGPQGIQGVKGDSGEKGDTGAAGKSFRYANINIESNGEVNLTDISNPDGIAVGDIIADNQGDIYTITAVTDTNVHVSDVLTAGMMKGPKGDNAPTPVFSVDADGVLSVQ